ALAAGDQRIALLDQSKTLLDTDRDKEKLAIYQKQTAEVAARIALLEEEQRLNPSEDGAARLDGLRSKQAGIGASAGALAPTSAGDGIAQGAAATLNQFGSDADIVARGVQASFGGVFEGLKGSIEGLISGTMTWGDALRNIGSSILSGVISAIAEMFATWMVKRLMIFTFGETLKAAETTSTIAHETAALPAKTAGAVASGISSYGFALIGGLAALALIASLAFADGGRVSGPGTSTSDSIFARLSNGEHVMTAAAVQRVGGHAVLDEINAGRVPNLVATGGGAASPGGAGGGQPASISNHFHFDANEALYRAMNDPAGRRIVTDLLRQIQHEI
ncbi:MAG: hypothetical protein H7067_14075, partial [Burkholderiales bacterium]|nr:hypothetical protein [Opitutaceae bacterium]